MKEFNQFKGNDILSDWNNIYYDFDNIVKKYQFDYFIIYKDKEIDILIKKAYNYEKLYEDNYFILWRIPKDINT